MAENRQFPRKQVTSPIAFQIGEGPLIEAESQDISLGGMFITTPEPPPYGAAVKIYINLPGMRQETVIDAIVRWNKGGGMGVHFGRMGARETHALTILISEGSPEDQ